MRRVPSLRDIVTRVRSAIIREGMIPPRSRVLVAFSGGPDSTALLNILVELGREIPFDLAVAHFNHRLRPAADADERFAKAAARRLGLPFVSGRADVRAYARAKKMNVEEAARRLRYAFLERAAARLKADRVATGHTLDDQAETVLLRLLRGSGSRGLAGIPAARDRIIRPLLGIRRDETVAYCRGRKLAFRTDESNRDRRLRRNRVRLDLIPYLERRFEPGIVPILGRTAAVLGDENAVLEDLARRAYARLLRRTKDSPGLDARRLAALKTGAARLAVRAFLEDLRGDLLRVSFEDVEAVRVLKPGRTRVLPGGMRVRREGDLVQIQPEKPKRRPRSFSCAWDGREPLALPGSGRVIRGARTRSKPGRGDFDDRTRAYFDLSTLSFPLIVRSRKNGDRFRPLGAPGRQKLNELLRSRGVPPSERGSRPVFCSNDEIIWTPGLPVGDRFKITPRTKTVFVIRAGDKGPLRPR